MKQYFDMKTYEQLFSNWINDSGKKFTSIRKYKKYKRGWIRKIRKLNNV